MKVLIVRVGAMGDVLHALPAVASLQALQPEWEIDWVVDPRWSPLLVDGSGRGPVIRHAPLADTRLWSSAPLSRVTFRSIRALRQELRQDRYDIAIDMQGTLRSAVIAWLSGAPVRAGYSDPRERPAAWFYTEKFPRRAAHVVEQGSELLAQALRLPVAAAGHTPLPHEPWADEWAAAEVASGPLALLAPGAGWAAKQWPTARFGALARELRARGFDVAVTAARQDNGTAAQVLAASGPAGDRAARLLVADVAGLVALTRRAAVVVGGDSGPLHLAAALEVPLVCLFGPTDPARNGPWAPGAAQSRSVRVLRDPASVTSYRHVEAEDPGLLRISVEQALQAALEVVQART